MFLHNLFFKSHIRGLKNPVYEDNSRLFHSKLIIKQNPLIKITAHDKAVETIELGLIGKNLFNGEFNKGFLKAGDTKLYEENSDSYKTTKWFPVLAKEGLSLVLSGTGHNRSTWQFMTSEEMILTSEGIAQKYKIATDVMQDKTVSKVIIPENAVCARVYYACLEDDSLDDRIQIEYGQVPTHYEPFRTISISLPPLNKGESITYEKGQWTLVTKKEIKNLDLGTFPIEVGNTIMVSCNSCMLDVTYEDTTQAVISTGLYGVRWNMNDSNPICERVGDSKGLTFNAMHNNIYLTPYENSYDRIYPWSDLKICNMKVSKGGQRHIIYSNHEDFRLDGTVGNVMVEIPKFYCKREVIDDFEYLWISATEREGFVLDPSFITTDGVVDHIYIGAYLSSINNKKLISASGTFPVIRKSFVDLLELTNSPKGVKQCDLLAILTLQKLFVVETAVLDSQSIFAGIVHLPYLLKDKTTSFYALKSEKSTNRIIVKATKVTKRFCISDAISILESWNDYKNIPSVYQREIISIKDIGKESLEIVFSGDPIDITQQETGITCLPCKNGMTDAIPCASGSIGELSGHDSFKYRGVENLWGNVSILLDKAYVKDSEITIHYPSGEIVKLDYHLPVQEVELSPTKFGDPANMIVKRMGYDKNNPLIMLPCELGNGATTSSYYCDAWYNLAEEGVTYILTYGGAWDNKGYAGIFNFRASFTDTKKMPYNGSRIMLR